MRRLLVSSIAVVALVCGLASGAQDARSAAERASAGPRIVQVEAFAAPGGQLLAHAEVLRGGAKPPVAWFSVGGRKVKARREALDGSEGPGYLVDYSARFAAKGQPLRVGDRVRVTIRACTSVCTSLSKRVRVESFDDR